MNRNKKIKHIYLKFFVSIMFLLIGTNGLLYAQQPAKSITNTPKKDTSSTPLNDIIIIHSDRTIYRKLDDTTALKILSGHVEVKQKSTLFYCDSLMLNPTTRILEAYGHVHINDNDSVNIYADFLRYQGVERKAFLKNNVKLTDSKSTLTTTQLDYDLNTKVAVYTLGGKLINGSSVLTSLGGVYYGDTRDANFTTNVLLVDPQYTIATDTLLYNTYSKIATFTVPTKITSGKYKKIITSDGYYDLINKKSYLGKRPIIIDSSSTLIADEVAADDKSGFGEARGKVIFKDTAQGIVLLCNDLKTNRVQSSFLATVNPVMILKQGADSVFIAADTLYSARYADDSLDQKTAAKDQSVNNPTDTIQVPVPSSHISIKPDSTSQIPDTTVQKKIIPAFKKIGKTFVWAKDSTNGSSENKEQRSSIKDGENHSNKRNLFGLFKRKINEDTHASGAKDSLPNSKKVDRVNVGKRTPSIIDSARDAKLKSAIIDSVALKNQPLGIDMSPSANVNKKDSIKQEDNKSRFLEAYYNVRIYSDSLQGIGDSLYYSSRDSLFQLFKKPTVWTTSNNQISQISGDTINLYTENNKPHYLKVWRNAIMISQADTLHIDATSEYFNQISGNSIESWFTDGQIDSIAAKGNAQLVFYLLDAYNKYIGVDVQSSRNFNFYFKNKALQRAVGLYDVVGKTYPMRQVDHKSIRLNHFDWLDDKRPKSKYELLAH
ncbi:MAG TPA: OstA-like protein [Arachidicoccus soli]|nr:OstA-like protein [Arachidicoccus soli]